MREPTLQDLTAYVCAIQPELDPAAAERVLRLDDGLKDIIASAWTSQRANAAAILELHLSLTEGTPA